MKSLDIDYRDQENLAEEMWRSAHLDIKRLTLGASWMLSCVALLRHGRV